MSAETNSDDNGCRMAIPKKGKSMERRRKMVKKSSDQQKKQDPTNEEVSVSASLDIGAVRIVIFYTYLSSQI